jgi:hypothetical protein
LKPADFALGAGKPVAHGSMLAVECAQAVCVLVTLLAKRFLKAGALRKLSPRPGELLSQLAVLPLQVSGAGRQVGDTATIPGLLVAQSEQTSLGSAQSQARLFQISMCALQLLLERAL